MDSLYKPIPYSEWVQEAEQVAQEELQRDGWTPSTDSIMRRASSYMLRVEENEHGGLTIYVQDGWKQAMRLHMHSFPNPYEDEFNIHNHS